MEFVDPCAGGGELIVGKVTDFGGGEWPTKSRHPFVPGLLSHDAQSLDMIEVSGIPFDVLPESANIPAVEGAHRDENANLSVFQKILSISGTNLS